MEKLRQTQELTGYDHVTVNQRLNKTLQQFSPNTTVDVIGADLAIDQVEIFGRVEQQVGSRDLKKYAVVEVVIRQAASKYAVSHAQEVIDSIRAFHSS